MDTSIFLSVNRAFYETWNPWEKSQFKGQICERRNNTPHKAKAKPPIVAKFKVHPWPKRK